jgi:dipeptidyl aminopeptidase/acylaminoacyl peptidase
MRRPKIASFGSWRSPITAQLVAAYGMGSSTLLTDLQLSGESVYWIEPRVHDAGRQVIMRWSPDGGKEDLTPPGYSARSRVHEYGGGAFCTYESTIFFSNFKDQRIYQQEPNAPPLPITPIPEVPSGLRFTDGRVTRDGRWIICVQERHLKTGQVINELVTLPCDGSQPPRSIESGHDFYANPRISPDGTRLAWLAWDHPQMPWDGTELWMGRLGMDGSIAEPHQVTGGLKESILQPEWSPDGRLHFISDRSGWWNLYCVQDESVLPIITMEADIGMPPWRFGFSCYAFLSDGRVACIFSHKGLHKLGIKLPGSNSVEQLPTGFTSFYPPFLKSDGNQHLWFIAGNFVQPPSIVHLDPEGGSFEVVHRTFEHNIDPGYLSLPRTIEFPTDGQRTSHALFYPPANKDYHAPTDKLPPLLVFIHGGPTSARPHLQFEIQYWTSRGIAVVDVNYGGSTGFGRAYRERLKGQWGVVDRWDCIKAARYLADQVEVAQDRLMIRGGSAGGYTTLSALTFHDLFSAGASYFGVADVEALTKETHKFESHYLESLIGVYPEEKELYRSRSPIHFADRLSCPIILFQGLEDRVVPPAQAEAMIKVLKQKGLPYAYLSFSGEGHGFRMAETIQRCLEAELYFYSQIFGFEVPDPIEPVQIENL